MGVRVCIKCRRKIPEGFDECPYCFGSNFKVRCYTDRSEEVWVDYKGACRMLLNLELSEDNFITFIRDDGECIQFIRLAEDTWFLDYPASNGREIYQAYDLKTERVLKILEKFFSHQNWKRLVNLIKIE